LNDEILKEKRKEKEESVDTADNDLIKRLKKISMMMLNYCIK
jgi:hypothetical protein